MLSAPPAAFAHLRGMPDCFAILVPVYPVRADVLDAQVAWFRATFGERARLGLVQLQRALDGAQREEIRAAGERRGVPVVALGDVTMHRRSCKPLQDVMTAIRVGMPVAECGYALAPNAEQHLRPRQRIGQLYSPDELANLRDLDACISSSARCATSIPTRSCRRGSRRRAIWNRKPSPARARIRAGCRRRSRSRSP
jgi:error-prone DNA polymerase